MIRIESVTLAPGGEPLLEGADWHIRESERVGLVGRNGTGKSTRLRAIVGEAPPADGRVHIRNNLRLGYLPQQAVSGSTQSVWDEVRSQMHHLQRLRADLAAAEQDLARHAPGSPERHERALEAFRIAGGFQEEETVGSVLHGLGFSPETWHRSCTQFSGGWQMRIALARLLLSQPDVALLDEPTNHLDLLARSWLAGFLARAPFAAVVVSHDRHLLDRFATRIVEVRAGRLHHYTGNFSNFLEQRELRIEQHQTAFERQQAEIARLERFVTRFKAKATKATQAQSRQKQLDKIERLDAPEAIRLPRFSRPEAPASDFTLATLRGVSLGWTPEQTVLRGVELALERGMRLAVLGPNGSGKSTLLSAISGKLKPHAGRRALGDRVRMGVFTQDLAADLPPDLSGLEYVVSTTPMTPPEKIRTILGALGLSGEDALRPIRDLSGGEKARVALTALTARPHNLLLLDEPTNHLDTETVEVLVRALQQFEGGMVLVTHDRYLVESLATHVLLVLPDGSVDLHIGVRPSDLELKPPETTAAADAPSAGALSFEELKQRRRDRDRLKKRLTEIETAITATEARIARIDDDLCQPDADYAALSAERQRQNDALDRLMGEWEQVSEQVEASEG